MLSGLFFTGCSFKHNVDTLDINSINNHKVLMKANQSFHCQNGFVGGAHKFIVNKGDLIKGYKLPANIKVSSFGEIEGGLVDERAILLKHKELQGRDFGYLVFPDGTFVYDRGEEQLGVLAPFNFGLSDDEFMFNIKCFWIGKTPFSPVSYEELQKLKED
jgi:hypothetical protein